jgi:hypothetical protein
MTRDIYMTKLMDVWTAVYAASLIPDSIQLSPEVVANKAVELFEERFPYDDIVDWE